MPAESAEIIMMIDQHRLDESGPTEGRSLKRLIKRAKSGDTRAFEELMITRQRRVVSLAWRILGSEDEAKDASQEVFIRLYKHLGTFDSKRDFDGWLYRIVVDVCRDLRRKGDRHSVSLNLLSREEQVETLSGREEIESTLLRKQQRAIIARLLATALSEKERVALVLRDLEGLPTREVARILGSKPTTVRTQISSARAKLKKARDRFLKKQQRGFTP